MTSLFQFKTLTLDLDTRAGTTTLMWLKKHDGFKPLSIYTPKAFINKESIIAVLSPLK